MSPEVEKKRRTPDSYVRMKETPDDKIRRYKMLSIQRRILASVVRTGGLMKFTSSLAG